MAEVQKKKVHQQSVPVAKRADSKSSGMKLPVLHPGDPAVERRKEDLVECMDAQDTALWDAQFAASHDILSELFDEIMAESAAGSTIEIR